MKSIKKIQFDELNETMPVVGNAEKALYWGGSNAQRLIDAMLAADDCSSVNASDYGFGHSYSLTTTVTINGVQVEVTIVSYNNQNHPSVSSCYTEHDSADRDRYKFIFKNSTSPTDKGQVNLGLHIYAPRENYNLFYDNFFGGTKYNNY